MDVPFVTAPAWRGDNAWRPPAFHNAQCCEYLPIGATALGADDSVPGVRCGAESMTGLGWHHCRACGVTVCSSHSRSIMWLPASSRVRVCDRCRDHDRQWIRTQSHQVQQCESRAMADDGIAVNHNSSKRVFSTAVFAGNAWTHAWFSKSQQLTVPPGHRGVAQAQAPEGSITVVAAGQ